VGDKCGRQVWETSVNSCGPRQAEWETRVEDKCGRQVWKTRVGDKCKLMRPKAPRVGDKWETGGPRHPEWETSVGDKWKTSVKSFGPRHPEWETSVEDKCGRQA